MTTNVEAVRLRQSNSVHRVKFKPHIISDMALVGRETDLEQAIADWGEKRVAEWADGRGWTLLFWACHSLDGSAQGAMRLLNLGADMNRSTNSSNTTPLHACAERGTAKHLTIARCLLNNGADDLLKTSGGDTPLDFARIFGHTELAQLLEQHAGINGAQVAPITNQLALAGREADLERAVAKHGGVRSPSGWTSVGGPCSTGRAAAPMDQ